jgi:CMP-N-acetylneuraminic acid synthetase/spore coat polysaccharide biosynthesis predicted glycosyltransferase SpsG
MIDGKRILIILPARGGSKGIPRKNIRLLAGKPLLSYGILTAKACRYVDEVYVSTDDEEISTIASRYGAKIIPRPSELAGDSITLDPVIFNAVETIEKEHKGFDIIVTLQPTSPLLSVDSFNRAIKFFNETGADCVLSVVENTHLFWVKERGNIRPFYPKRLNRQELSPIFRETGGFVISSREVVTENSRISGDIRLFPLSREESIDIDDRFDWWIAEKVLKRKRIVLRVDGYRLIGLGHVYRCISIAERLIDHDIMFLMDERYKMGIEFVRSRFHKVFTFGGDVMEALGALNPDIIINDILDTSAGYIKQLKERNWLVVNFEDLGRGIKHADLVINALYEADSNSPNILGGPAYFCLRDEFYSLPPKKGVSPALRRVLVTFGGTDENNLTIKVLKALEAMNGEFIVNVITGFGYTHEGELKKYLKQCSKRVIVVRDTRSISQYMYDADLVITSGGRTVYEVASVRTPCLVLCQNQRELTHRFFSKKNGILNLGLGTEVEDSALRDMIKHLLKKEPREKMFLKMSKFDFHGGVDRVIDAIKNVYKSWTAVNVRNQRRQNND